MKYLSILLLFLTACSSSDSGFKVGNLVRTKEGQYADCAGIIVNIDEKGPISVHIMCRTNPGCAVFLTVDESQLFLISKHTINPTISELSECK